MELLEQVESYLARTRVPPSTFGRRALGDPRFVDDLRAGRKLRRKTQERVRCYLTQIQSSVT
jgi:2,4-dienoyl-CoA reductase-like NADH-dependent reductase (Old Yellow Enzyme family)